MKTLKFVEARIAKDTVDFAKVRKLMGKTLLEDKDLYYGYQSNIAMLLYDEQDKNNGEPVNYKDEDNRNEIAKKIINLIFS